MINSRRRALMMQGHEVSPLPAGYKQLAYLESNGHQYFDIQAALGSSPLPSPVAILDIELTQTGINQGIFGFQFPGGNRRFALSPEGPGSSTNILALNSNTIYIAPQYPNDTQRHSIIMTIYQNENGYNAPVLKIDDGPESIGWYVNQSSSATTWAKSALFAVSHYSSWSNTIQPNMYAHMKGYRAQFYMGTEFLRDFMPAFRKSDGVPGMFDFVSETLFVNEGTGQFGYEDMNGNYTAPI